LKLGGAQFFDETTAATPAIGNEQAAAAALQPLCAAGCDGILIKKARWYGSSFCQC
jgi:hypothetical protein